jgi:small multidrug resistance pump
MHYLYLAIAIVGEVIGTSALQASNEFRRPGPSLLVVAGYACAFYFMSLTLKSMPVGVVYAIWSGLGVVLVGVAAAILYRQVPDRPAVLGMALIVSGVIVINVFSKTVSH